MFKPVYAASNIDYPFSGFNSAADFIQSLVLPAFGIAGILLVFYIVIAAIKWMTSGGEKQAVADARSMITHAIIGFVGLLFLFLLVKFLQETFKIGVAIIK